MARVYKISEVCGDWALHIPPYGKTDTETILIFNSRNNAELVKSVLEWEDVHPNAAVPYRPARSGSFGEVRAGLYGKYTVYKNKDGSLVTDCFILRPAKDPAAVAALRAYAAATDNAELAADIASWVGVEPNEPLTLEQLREMDEQPVYVVPVNEHSELGGWCVIDVFDSDDYSGAFVPGVEYWVWRFEAYGEQWLAYRRPPEGASEQHD